MNVRRVAFGTFFFFLPGLVLVAATLYYCVTEALRRERSEPRRLTYAYREQAKQIIENPKCAQLAESRPPGSAVGQIRGKPWGYILTDRRSTIWMEFSSRTKGKQWRILTVPRQSETPWILLYLSAGVAFSVLVLTFSFLGYRFFVWLVKERDDFLAATAHDLTTPLVGLRLTIGRDDAESKVLVERMVRLVTNLKDFMNLGGRRPAPEAKAFDLLAAYHEAYRLFAADYRDVFDGEDVSVTVNGDVRVHADETLTVQILWNLLGNDLKYAAPYGRVWVEMSREGGLVRLALLDNGPGLTPQQRRRVFKRYYRAQTVEESGKGGFGIGLCTARDLAKAMGGRLTVEPNQPKGCVFLLYLPAAI